MRPPLRVGREVTNDGYHVGEELFRGKGLGHHERCDLGSVLVGGDGAVDRLERIDLLGIDGLTDRVDRIAIIVVDEGSNIFEPTFKVLQNRQFAAGRVYINPVHRLQFVLPVHREDDLGSLTSSDVHIGVPVVFALPQDSQPPGSPTTIIGACRIGFVDQFHVFRVVRHEHPSPNRLSLPPGAILPLFLAISRRRQSS